VSKSLGGGFEYRVRCPKGGGACYPVFIIVDPVVGNTSWDI